MKHQNHYNEVILFLNQYLEFMNIMLTYRVEKDECNLIISLHQFNTKYKKLKQWT